MNHPSSPWRRLLAWSLLPILALAAGASVAQVAPARSYSVLSELARELQVVIFQQSTGSNLDANLKQRMPIPGGVIDRAALQLSKARIATLQPGTKVATFAPLDSDVFDNRQSFDRGSDAGVPPDLLAALRQQGSSHLLLLTRYQADAAIQFRNAKLGTGRLEGLGFYIDNQTELDHSSNSINGRGFLAPFVYIRATLVDAANGRVVRSATHTVGQPVPATAGTESTHPWDALDANQKVRMLTAMLDTALETLIPQVLASP